MNYITLNGFLLKNSRGKMYLVCDGLNKKRKILKLKLNQQIQNGRYITVQGNLTNSIFNAHSVIVKKYPRKN